GIKTSAVAPNETVAPTPAGLGGQGMQLGRAAADFAARDMILSLRNLAKNLASVPGRKTLILLTAGFPVQADQISEVTATIDACNRANVAVYPIDVRGLVSGVPLAELTAPHQPGRLPALAAWSRFLVTPGSLTSGSMAFFQRGGAGGGTGAGAGGGGAAGGGG